MKTYIGTRTPNGCTVTVDGQPLDPRFDLRNHSPDGFEWGYGGSGPAQLALAIVSDHMGDDMMAQAIYQDFKFEVVAKLPKTGWELTSEQVDEALRRISTRQ